MVYRLFARTSHRRDPTAHHLVGPPMVFADYKNVFVIFYRTFAEHFWGHKIGEYRLLVHNATYIVPMNFTFDMLDDMELANLVKYIDYHNLLGDIADSIIEVDDFDRVVTDPDESEYVPLPPYRFVLAGFFSRALRDVVPFYIVPEEIMYDCMEEWVVYKDYSFASETIELDADFIENSFSFTRPGYWLFACDEPLCVDMKNWMPEKDLLGMATHLLAIISKHRPEIIDETDPGLKELLWKTQPYIYRQIANAYLEAIKSHDIKQRVLAAAEHVAKRALEEGFIPVNPHPHPISPAECKGKIYAGWVLDVAELARMAGKIIKVQP